MSPSAQNPFAAFALWFCVALVSLGALAAPADLSAQHVIESVALPLALGSVLTSERWSVLFAAPMGFIVFVWSAPLLASVAWLLFVGIWAALIMAALVLHAGPDSEDIAP